MLEILFESTHTSTSSFVDTNLGDIQRRPWLPLFKIGYCVKDSTCRYKHVDMQAFRDGLVLRRGQCDGTWNLPLIDKHQVVSSDTSGNSKDTDIVYKCNVKISSVAVYKQLLDIVYKLS